MKDAIRSRLLKAALAIAMGAAGVATYQAQQPSASVLLAMELGSHFESSGRHIGTPYIDKLGKGQPWTVCNGVTGAGVVAGRYYTPDDCKRLEMPRYLAAERQARAALRHWGAYNPWVQASFIDMVYNLGPGALDGTPLPGLRTRATWTGPARKCPDGCAAPWPDKK